MPIKFNIIDKIVLLGIFVIVSLFIFYEVFISVRFEGSLPLGALVDTNFWLLLAFETEGLVVMSVLLRAYTEKGEDKSWRYMAIIAFSLVGSVGVSAITSENIKDSPILIALAVSLCHFGYWAWKREHAETTAYQDSMKETTDKLEEILNTMPDRDAFRIMAENTSSIYERTNVLSIMAENASSQKEYEVIKKGAKEQLGIAIRSMCHISSLWTVSDAKLFEGNIMVAVSADKVDSIPNVAEAFEHGKHFFPDITTLANIADSCNRVLYVLTDLAVNTTTQKMVGISPLLLPVNIKSENHPGSIGGAPRAVENGHVDVVKDIDELLSSLPPNFIGKQKEGISDYFERQVNCGSIISIPFAFKENEEGVVDAVVNLYRPEDGMIKSPILYEYFTRPLVTLIAQLLYLYRASDSKAGNPECSEEYEVNPGD